MFRQDCAGLPVFSGMDQTQISQLCPFLEEQEFPKDWTIFQQGQPAKYIYILLSGEVVVNFKPYDGPVLTVARIDPGGVFGWSSALGRDVYTSGALAVQDSCAVRIHGGDLHILCEQYPETGMIFLDRLAGGISERFRSTQILQILSQSADIDGNFLRRMSQNGRK